MMYCSAAAAAHMAAPTASTEARMRSHMRGSNGHRKLKYLGAYKMLVQFSSRNE